MSQLHIQSSPEVAEVFARYPDAIRPKMLVLRELVLDVAREMEDVDQLTETLKWGEPSYQTKHGSTLRMDWKERAPAHYALYFQCSSRLVETFRMVFPSTFQYEGNRAIVFGLEDDLPTEELRRCIRATLDYHRVKTLSTLGI
ncbi:DUF1801 domain-containing protein [Pontibacter sp. G13]|uniref:DUF1801 domain-containing protein n=1 Tax=Pontibacter sp. G13 TaxID=3074898 RepID=UPI00288B0FA5|nr:DUF1801 domain-containing protein [Pontibacter sp. G13]WNJ20504.1 DUF1801 domain-containing protein [Pontibacter sp. G13]